MNNLRLYAIPVSLIVPGYEIDYTVNNVNTSPLTGTAIMMLYSNHLATICGPTPAYLD
jgi:hypothetical protein